MSFAENSALQDCLSEVTNHVVNGVHPNEALAKAAAANNLHPSGIPLVAQAYNNAVVNMQRMMGEDLHEKTASVDLADTRVVMDLMFSQPAAKTAAAVPKNSQAFFEDLNSSFEPAPQVTKVAHVEKEEPQQESLLVSPSRLVKDRNTHHWQKEAADFHSKKAAADIRLQRATNAVVSYLGTRDALNHDAIAERVVLAFGKQAGVLFREAAKHVNKSSDLLAKKASRVGDFETPLKLCRELCHAFNDVVKIAAITSGPGAGRPKPGGKPKPPKPSAPNQPGSFFEGVGRGFDIFGGRSTPAPSGASRDQAPSIPADDNSILSYTGNDLLDSLNTPSHAHDLKRIHAETAFVDLVNNDPMLASYSPEALANAFAELSSTVPDVVQNKPLLQTALRTYMAQGSLDPHATSSLLSTNDAMQVSPKVK